MTWLQLGAVALFSPLAVALVLLVAAPLRRTGIWAASLSLCAASISVAASAVLLAARLQGLDDQQVVVRWLPLAEPTAQLGIVLDGVSIPMLVVVSVVALCVQIYSLAYMEAEPPPAFGRYYTWHALFLFSMLGLVVAPNLLQLFVCWELVGLCSYLLIGFWYQKPSARRAAQKAFWMTKLADMGLLIGLIVQYAAVGTFGWDAATVLALDHAGRALPWVAVLYFVAVMGKSAQFPLHVWLPDAMEGPTPVSALLHAATMVAAGVYLLVRAFPIFHAAEDVLPWIAIVGGTTAIVAAGAAVVQTDLKKVLAYSTCSQLGYMVAALGADSLMGGYFHLTTHAFFKALLFLGAGSVIHATHTNEMPNMGGLWRPLKATTALFVIGALALAGLPLLSGFYSKDLVLEALWEATHHDRLYWWPFVACMASVALTAFYMGRAVFLTFFGAPRGEGHPHEAGAVMLMPMGVLAVGAIGAGWAGGRLAELWGAHYTFHLVPLTAVGGVATALALGGIALSWLVYHRGVDGGARAALAPVADAIRWGPVDRAWTVAYRGGLLTAAAALAWFDRYVIDGVMNAVGAGTLVAGERIRDMQTGQVQDYVFAVLVGVMAFAAAGQIWLGMAS